MLCLSLAEGEISPYQLTVQQRALLSDSNKPRERNSTLRSIELKRLPSVNTSMIIEFVYFLTLIF